VARSATTSTAGRGEEHGDAESQLDLDEATQAHPRHVAGRGEPAHREEIEGAQGEQESEDGDLGQHHHPVGGADHRIGPVDVDDGEPDAARHERGDGTEGHRREALKEPGRPRSVPLAHRRRREVHEPTHPHTGRVLMHGVHHEKEALVLEPGRRVADGGRGDGEENGQPRQGHPARP
jgi:hypothetical protein